MSLWVLLVVSVIISLVIVIPELNITSSNKQENIEKAKKNFAPPR